jgi:hypothetical protein
VGHSDTKVVEVGVAALGDRSADGNAIVLMSVCANSHSRADNKNT